MAELLWRDLQGQLLWVLVAFAGATLLPGRGLAERLGLVRGRLGPGRVALGLLGFLLLSNGLHRVIVALELLEGSTLGEIDSVVRDATPTAPLLVLLAIGLAPAFGEELLFRGLLLRWLAVRLPERPVTILRPLLVMTLAGGEPGLLDQLEAAGLSKHLEALGREIVRDEHLRHAALLPYYGCTVAAAVSAREAPGLGLR
ncbi:MAG: CPBP family intramembrane glutamic endopeptidase [Myxococcota bacterium]